MNIQKTISPYILGLVFFTSLFTSGYAANKWYVNDVVTAGDIYCSAAGNDGTGDGSATKPYATVTFVISNKILAAGDTVFIDSGDYTDNWMLNTGADGGSAVTPLVFKGAGTSLTKTVFTGGANGIYIGAGAGNSYITFLDFYLETTANVSTIYVEQGNNTNFIFQNCSIKSNVSGGAVVLKGCNNSEFHSCTISTIYDAIDVYSCSNCVFDGNTLTHRVPYVATQNHLGILLTGTALFGGAALADNNVVSSNKISGFNYGLDIQEEGTGNTWVNNYVWDCEYGMFCSLGGVGDHNTNTFKFNSILSDKDCIYGACLNWTILNNIFYTKGGAGSYCINLLDAANDPSTLDYNIYYYPTAGALAARRFATTYDTATWQGVIANDANSRGWDPKYTSTTNLDLLIGSSATSAALSDATVTDDVRRNPSVARTAVNQEIGAFEFVLPCGDTTLAASIPNVCTGAGTLDLDAYKGTAAAGSWSITGFPGGSTATMNVDGRTFNFNNTTGGTYTVRHTLTVVNPGCPASANRSFTIYSASVGGTVTADATVCSGSNGATLTLAGHTGTITGWESSTDNFATSTPIANTTTTQAYLNLVSTTKYRAIVQSGTCATDNSVAATITVDPVSVGGTVTADATVCSGANGANLTLAGHTGTITGWESSTDNFATSTPIINATATQAYLNLVTTTKYRAIVKSGACSADTSTVATITIDPVSVGGTVTTSTTVCSGTNSGTLHLNGNTGTITGWESSTNGFATSTPIVNTTDSLVYSNIAVNTQYRAVVKSGACASDNSIAATITIDPVSVGGTVTADATVCSGTNSGTLHLNGNTGTIIGWESSTDGFTTSTSIINTTDSLVYTNVAANTQYRAVVKSGTCIADNSVAATITVDPVSVGGTVTTDTTVCSGTNSGTLHLNGNTGTITGWESSTDGFGTTTPIVNTTDSLVYNNIAANTKYRAIVKSGTCSSANSTAATITVDAVSVGGIVSADDTVCSGANGATLTLGGSVGTVLGWESSTDDFLTSTPIVNSTTSLSYINITENIKYRAIVKSGVCPVDTSTVAAITVDSLSNSGLLTSDSIVCASANGAQLNLTGYTGTITDWESSTDNFTSSTSLGITNDTYSYSNLATTTQFRAIIKSGVCLADTSNHATISVNPVTVGGTITADDTVCSGANNAQLNLIGSLGTVTSWESSTDNFNTSNSLGNASSLTYSYLNLTANTYYRAIVKSGVCPADTSTIATITVDSVTVGGTVNSNDRVCSGANSSILNIVGQVGAVTDWEKSTGNFTTWISLANTGTTQPYSNLTITTKYRAIVKSGVCEADTSNSVTITVDSISTAGIMTADDTICSGTNGVPLTLSGNVGVITDWESSTDNFSTSTSLGVSANTYNYPNLVNTTKYRAIVKSGGCEADTSNIITITVDPISVGGIISADDTVCSGANSGTLHLNGITGNIIGWESSTDGFTTSTSIVNTTDSMIFSNIAANTKYRAIIKSGVCPIVKSTAATITIDLISVTINAAAVCEGSTKTFNAGAGFKTYNWQSGAGADSIFTASAQGIYEVIVTDSLGCLASDTAYLKVNAIPQPKLASDTATCKGISITLNPGNLGAVKYKWEPNGETTPTIDVEKAGKYKVTVSDNIGCSASAETNVNVNSLPIVELKGDSLLCNNNYDKITLTAKTNETVKYLWSQQSATSDSIIVNETGNYWVEVTNNKGCTSKDEIEITTYCKDFKFKWPNVITPNGDGKNDAFKAIGVDDYNYSQVVADVQIISFAVYNRWGVIMWHTEENVLPNWDGTLNGTPAPSGTYYFLLRYRNSAGNVYEEADYMTLMR